MIHVSLGTNDDPREVDGFRAAIRDVMDVAGRGPLRGLGEHRAPAVRGRQLPRVQPGARREDARRENLRVVNWVRMVREHPQWLADDGVHVYADGYAAALARGALVRRCG